MFLVAKGKNGVITWAVFQFEITYSQDFFAGFVKQYFSLQDITLTEEEITVFSKAADSPRRRIQRLNDYFAKLSGGTFVPREISSDIDKVVLALAGVAFISLLSFLVVLVLTFISN